jgi:CheY-like chemotaxis protein
VLQAENGHEALAALRASDLPVVVLLDYQMPGLGGDGVLAEVAGDPDLTNRHAFLLCTAGGRTFPPRMSALLDKLGVAVIRKPFEIDELVAQVHDACEELLAGAD